MNASIQSQLRLMYENAGPAEFYEELFAFIREEALTCAANGDLASCRAQNAIANTIGDVIDHLPGGAAPKEAKA